MMCVGIQWRKVQMFGSETYKILQGVGAIRCGHFVYTSGRHGDTYVDKNALYTQRKYVSRLCRMMLMLLAYDRVEVVVGPASGAVILANLTSFHISKHLKRRVRWVVAEKDGSGGFLIRPKDVPLIEGKRALIVDDVTTTGKSLKKVVEVVRACGGDIIAAVVIVNRGAIQASDVGDVPRLEQLLKLQLKSYPGHACDLCRHGIPISTNVGHGKEFLARKRT